MVKFDKLNLKSNSTQEFVPVIGDMMTARWSFEAMAVRQFKNNVHPLKRNVHNSKAA
jgi:hypothetical protein